MRTSLQSSPGVTDTLIELPLLAIFSISMDFRFSNNSGNLVQKCWSDLTTAWTRYPVLSYREPNNRIASMIRSSSAFSMTTCEASRASLTFIECNVSGSAMCARLLVEINTQYRFFVWLSHMKGAHKLTGRQTTRFRRRSLAKLAVTHLKALCILSLLRCMSLKQSRLSQATRDSARKIT